jgi:transcriptional regulator with XRE-family HTH domain
MSIQTPPTTHQSAAQLQALGEQIRAQRKALKVSATVAAEAAGMSRVTLHRIEKGEPSVAAGAWANAMAVLGLALQASVADDAGTRKQAASEPPVDLAQWIPVRVRLADYPQLKALAWQVHGTDALSPIEALGIYERNARHLDLAAMQPQELALLKALRAGLSGNTAAAVGAPREL